MHGLAHRTPAHGRCKALFTRRAGTPPSRVAVNTAKLASRGTKAVFQ
jgi:hypothetical protein